MSREYLRELTYELRHRGLEEVAIDNVLRELPPHSSKELAADFGSPKNYAESFPKGKRRTAGSVIVSIAVSVAVLAVAWRVVSVFILGLPQDLVTSLAVIGGGAVLVAIASVIAGQVDRRKVRSTE